MSNAKVCDMCGAVIRSNNEIVPQERYLITIQKVRLLKPETITVDLCKECFEAICDINRKKNEKLENKRRWFYMFSIAACIILGAIIGIILMIIISVLVVSGRQSDEEYERDLKEYTSSIEGSDGLERKDK